MATASKEKLLSVHPDDTTTATDTVHNIDDSLTNLDWLQTFSVIPSLMPERQNGVTASPCPPVVPLSLHQGSSDSPSGLLAGDTAASGVWSHPRTLSSGSDFKNLYDLYCPYVPLPFGTTDDNRANPKIKPLYTFASLICLAMQASKQPNKVSVSYIYAWVMANFSYYRHTKQNWQRSIRYTLSNNKCFMKVHRGEKDKRGKGGFWRINPKHAHMFVNGIYNSRKLSESYMNYKYNMGLGQNTTVLQGHAQAPGTDILQASMASIFDDVPNVASCNNKLEELVSAVASTPFMELGQGAVGEGVDLQNHQTSSQQYHHQSYGYTELSGGATVGYHMSQCQHQHQDLLPQDHHHHQPLHLRLQEASTLFPPQPSEVAAYPWAEQFIPLTLDQEYGLMNMLQSNVYFS